LGRDCGAYAIVDRREYGTKCVTDRFKDVPAIRPDSFTHQAVVAPKCDGHGRCVTIPPDRAAFDIGKEERERPRRWRGCGDGRGL